MRSVSSSLDKKLPPKRTVAYTWPTATGSFGGSNLGIYGLILSETL